MKSLPISQLLKLFLLTLQIGIGDDPKSVFFMDISKMENEFSSYTKVGEKFFKDALPHPIYVSVFRILNFLQKPM